MYDQLMKKVGITEAEAYVIDCFRIDCGYRYQSLLKPEFAQNVLNFSLFLRKNEISEEIERISAGVLFLRLVILKQAKKDVKLVDKKIISEAIQYLVEVKVRVKEELKKKERSLKMQGPEEITHRLELLEEMVSKVIN